MLPFKVFRKKFSRVFFTMLFLTADIIQITIVSTLRLIPDQSFLGFTVVSEINPAFTITLVILVFAIQVAVSFLLIRVVFRNPRAVQIYPQKYSDEEILQKLELESMEKINHVTTALEELAADYLYKIKRVYIYSKPVPNAFTVNVIPLPRVHQYYLIFNSNVLDVLEKDEIRAVVAHELGHVVNGDSFVKVVSTIPRLFLQIAYSWLYFLIGTGILVGLAQGHLVTSIQRVFFFLIAFVIISVVTHFSTGILYRANRATEHLADYHAVKKVGLLPTVNMLVRLGQRNEVMSILKQEITWLYHLSREDDPDLEFLYEILSKFPKNEFSEDKARELAPRLFLEQEIEQLREIYFLDIPREHLDPYLENAANKLREMRKQYFQEVERLLWEVHPDEAKEMTLDWRDYDVDMNLLLDEEELDNLVKAIKKKKELLLFENEIVMPGENRIRDHPTFRDRLLFVYDVGRKRKMKKTKKN